MLFQKSICILGYYIFSYFFRPKFILCTWRVPIKQEAWTLSHLKFLQNQCSSTVFHLELWFRDPYLFPVPSTLLHTTGSVSTDGMDPVSFQVFVPWMLQVTHVPTVKAVWAVLPMHALLGVPKSNTCHTFTKHSQSDQTREKMTFVYTSTMTIVWKIEESRRQENTRLSLSISPKWSGEIYSHLHYTNTNAIVKKTPFITHRAKNSLKSMVQWALILKKALFLIMYLTMTRIPPQCPPFKWLSCPSSAESRKVCMFQNQTRWNRPFVCFESATSRVSLLFRRWPRFQRTWHSKHVFIS